MHRDEAFLSYNAYSILQTGSDISGNFLPVHLESFLFSPAGYSYLSIPFIAIFGLNEFSARVASAFFGTLTIALVYLISVELFKENKNKNLISALSAFFLAIMPWHVNLSRVAVENTPVVFFICLGVLVYLKFLKIKADILLIFSFFSFAINFFIYQAPRAFLPLFLPFLAISFSGWKKILSNKLQVALYSLFILLPVIIILFSPTLSLRIQSLSIFQHPETKLSIREQLVNDTIEGVPQLISRAFHNKISGYSFLFFDNYFSHVSYDFLFSDKGFPDRFRIPNMGLLYIYQLPLILIAFVSLYGKSPRIDLFLFGWIGISFLGSALTFDDVPNLQRTLIAVPAFAILSGIGAFEVLDWMKKRRYFPLLAGAFLLIVILNFSYFLIQYFIQGKVYRTWYRQDGYKELVEKTNKLLPNYEKAVISSRETGATILFLFYSKYDPEKFQEETKNLDTKNSDHISFYKYEFTDEECPVRIDQETKEITGERGILYVNSSLCDEVSGAQILDKIRREGRSEAFHIVELK